VKKVGYGRTSTDDQTKRETIENQVIFINKYADLHKIELLEVYKDDGVSGVIPFSERKAARQLLQDADKGLFDTVLVFKLDRLGRTARNVLNAIAELEAKGLKVKSLTEPFDTETPTGRLMVTMLAGFADLDRSNIIERLQYGAEIAAKQGKWLGGIVPYGYRVDEQGYLEINEDKMPCGYSEADTVRLIYDLLADKKGTAYMVADELNRLNIPTHYIKDGRLVTRGKRKVHTDGVWRPNRIGNLVRNSVYMGIHEYGKRTNKERQTIRREVPAIVSSETHRAAAEQMRSNRAKSSRNTRNRVYLLSGIISCGYCGRAYCGLSFKGKTIDGAKTYVTYYKCNGRSGDRYVVKTNCDSGSVNAEVAEEYIWNICKEIIRNPEEFKRNYIAKYGQESRNATTNYREQIEKLRMDLTNLESEKQNILVLYRRNLISIDDIEIQLREIEKENKTIKDKIKDYESKIIQDKKDKSDTKEFTDMISGYKMQIADADAVTKRMIITSLISRVYVHKRKGEKEAKFEIECSFF